MNRRQLAAGALVVAVAGLVPTAAAASQPGSAAKTPKPPQTGRWVVTNQSEVAGGSFTVTSKHADVTGLRVTIGPSVQVSCGTGSIAVLGKQKVHDAKGHSPFAGTYNFWIVGRNTPKALNMFSPNPVTLSRKGTHFKGRLELTFVGTRGGKEHTPGGFISSGELFYHGSCELNFSFRHR
jgi:hypothetical protein